MASRGTFPRPRGHRHARLFAVLGLLSLGTAWSFASFARASSVGARATEGTTSSSTTTLKDDLLKRCEDFKQKQTEMWDLMDDEAETEKDKASLLEAESFAAQRVQLSDELQELRAKCVEVIEELAEKNPTAQPTIGKLRGFRVFVEGKALSDDEIELIFRKVRLLRRSRFLPEITIPLPGPGLLRAIGRLFARSKGGKVNESNRGAGFKLLYVDDDLRMHKTFDGLYFVQRRLH
ncbi:unnamed protein product [Durusdinium trenchii]|uniref:Uncharacterized protein n=1 Tax=Durusdinium trenchii TaxID=1381693 RepID=A0ABP0Q9V8_9DINO